MRVALLQAALIWEDAKANRSYFQEKIALLDGKADLVILPEMFTTGFTMNPTPVAEPMTGETVAWMQSIAEKNKTAVCGSLVIIADNQFYNRFLFVFPTGEIRHYDKRHLFTLSGEREAYTAGKEKIIIEYRGFRICPMICYDLRFGVFSRNVEDFDLLIYAANWPKPRINAWDILLKARAIENMCFVAGVNRIGKDFNQYEYSGHSQLVDYLGEYIIEPMKNEGQQTAFLNKEKMLETRAKLGFLNDRDTFTVN